jgi:hypothetical protein
MNLELPEDEFLFHMYTSGYYSIDFIYFCTWLIIIMWILGSVVFWSREIYFGELKENK